MKHLVRAMTLACAVTVGAASLFAPGISLAAEEARPELGPREAAERAAIMAMDLRELVGPDDKRIENVANELAALGAPVVPSLLDLLTDPVAAVRRAAVMALGALRPAEALAPMVARLGDEEPSVTVAAARSLGGFDDEWATRALVRWLAHPHPDVQRAILRVLGTRPSQAIHGIIRHQLESPPAGVGPGPFLAALGRFPDRKTQRELIATLSDVELAPWAIKGLAFLGSKAARDAAQWLRKNAASRPDTASGVAQVLVGFGAAGDKALAKVLPGMPLELKREIVGWLVAADEDAGARRVTALARHKDAGLRLVALERMPHIPGADPRPSVKENLRHKDGRVRVLAADAVVGQRDHQLERILITRYREVARGRSADNIGERAAILLALGRVGQDEAVAELVQAIGHDDEAGTALQALGRIGEPSIGSLLFVIKTGDPVRTPLAVQALASAGPAAVAPLLRLLTHRSRDVRNVARRALRDIRPGSVVPDIVELIKDESTPGREQLLALLGELYGDETYAALKMFARSSSEHGIRLAAVRVLSQQADPRVLPVLRTVAEKDINNAVRHLAVRALLWQHDREAVPLLIKILEYDKDFIRKSAAQALGYLASPADVPDIVPKLSTPRDEILTAVRDGLRRITFMPRLVKAEQFDAWADEFGEREEVFASLKAGEMTLGDGTVLHYWLGGRGRPMLVLPGGPDLSHRYLRPAMDRLMEDRLLVYVDLPGRGESPGPTAEGAQIGVEHDVASVAVMLARLNLRDIDVYGHGWGSLVAVRLADKHPKLVHRVVLDNTPMPTLDGWVSRHELATERIPEPWSLDLPDLDADRALWQPLVLHRTAALAMLTGSLARPAVLVDVWRKLDGRPEVQGAILAPMGNFDLTAVFARITKPTLILHGPMSPLDPAAREWRDTLARDNENVRVIDLEGVGLLPFYENPEGWEEAVSSFLL